MADCNRGALDEAHRQLAYWEDRVATLTGQLQAKDRIYAQRPKGDPQSLLTLLG